MRKRLRKKKQLPKKPKKRISLNFHPSALALSLILLVGGFVRLYRIEQTMRFVWDEGRDMLNIRRMLVNHDLTLMGPFNEIDNRKDFFGVFHYYLMAPALWLADYNPLGPAVFTSVLGIMSIVLVFLLVRQWEDVQTGLLVSLLYAVSPLVITYVRWPLNPNTIPFFALCYGLVLTRFNRQSVWWLSAIAGLFLGLLFQLHYFTIVLGVWWVMVGIHHFEDFKAWLRHSLWFIGGWWLPNLSFVVFDLTHKHFYWKIVKLFIFPGTKASYTRFSLHQLWIPFSYTADVMQKLTGVSSWLGWLLGCLVLGMMVWQVVYWIRSKKLTLAAWISGGYLLFLVLISFFPDLYDDYHSSAFYFGLLYLMVLLVTWVERVVRSHLAALFVYLIQFVLMLSRANAWLQPIWPQTMPQVRAVSNLIAQNTHKGSPFNILVLTDSDAKGVRYRYFLDVAGLTPLSMDQYPEAQILYVVSKNPSLDLSEVNIWEAETFGDSSLKRLGQVDDLYVFVAQKD